ncbi:MAG: ankyrin repeat domain-containing protein [Desulfovibrio sp.]|nr:ankyrin repeat domain-containing protein [Desulfovibrio sp.]
MTSAPCALALGSLLLASLVLPAAVFGQPVDEDIDLFDAAQTGDAGQIRQCASHGCPLNLRDDRERTPLHYAAMRHQHEAVAALLEAGADAGARDRQGYTPLAFAGTDKYIIESMLARGASPNARHSQGGTLLEHAIRTEDTELAGLLLSYGASLRFDDGLTAFDLFGASPALEAKFKEAGIYQRMEVLARAPGQTPVR